MFPQVSLCGWWHVGAVSPSPTPSLQPPHLGAVGLLWGPRKGRPPGQHNPVWEPSRASGRTSLGPSFWVWVKGSWRVCLPPPLGVQTPMFMWILTPSLLLPRAAKEWQFPKAVHGPTWLPKGGGDPAVRGVWPEACLAVDQAHRPLDLLHPGGGEGGLKFGFAPSPGDQVLISPSWARLLCPAASRAPMSLPLGPP